LELASLGLADYSQELPPELSELIDPGAGVAVEWLEEEGWHPSGDR
jgi:hypothetical protein